MRPVPWTAIAKTAFTMSALTMIALVAVSSSTPAQECETHFDSTFEAIQEVIFENRGCAGTHCHTGPAAAGGLDLSDAETSYANLVDQPVKTIPIEDSPTMKRVLPNAQGGGKSNSLLWLNVASATLPELWEAPLRPMPLGGLPPLSIDELQLLQIWIEHGAPFDSVVPGTDRLVDACLPKPRPIKAPPLDPPAPEEGVQIISPLQVLPPQSERVACFVSYYDFTGRVPEESLGAGGTTFRIRRVVPRQDPLSHHANAEVYDGDTPIDSPVWGTFACRGGDKDEQGCDPRDQTFCGEGSVCGSQPIQSGGCIGFGPGDARIGIAGIKSIFNSMASISATEEGVYDELPIEGIVVWNSHAFNVFDEPAELEMWINLEFASTEEQQHELRRFADISATDKMNPPPYGADQVCHRLALPDRARILDISSHTHKRGKRFQVFEGYFACDGGPNNGDACTPFGPEPDFPVADLCAGAPCTAILPPEIGDCDGDLRVSVADLLAGVNMLLEVPGRGACSAFDPDDDGVSVSDIVRAVRSALEPKMRDPAESLIYTTLTYADPLVLHFRPSRMFAPPGAPRTHRTLTYCALYDNGFSDPRDVKRRSMTPPNGKLCDPTHCAEGSVGSPCRSDSECDSSPGAGDGFCDACSARFGVTTDDEMFVLMGSYFVE